MSILLKSAAQRLMSRHPVSGAGQPAVQAFSRPGRRVGPRLRLGSGVSQPPRWFRISPRRPAHQFNSGAVSPPRRTRPRSSGNVGRGLAGKKPPYQDASGRHALRRFGKYFPCAMLFSAQGERHAVTQAVVKERHRASPSGRNPSAHLPGGSCHCRSAGASLAGHPAIQVTWRGVSAASDDPCVSQFPASGDRRSRSQCQGLALLS